jgi:hypothetical protein
MRAWMLVAVASFALSSFLVGSKPAAADTEIDVDGQVRLRLEAWNFDRGTALTQGRLLKTDTRHFVLQRARFGLKARVSSDVTAYILAQDARTWGATGTLSLLRNLDIHQAWAEVRHQYDKTYLRVRGGRQKLSYGIERIIGGLEWANPARAFDALKVEVKRSIWTLDLDAARVLQSGQSQSLVVGRDEPVLRGVLAGNDDVFVVHNRFDIPDMTLYVDAYAMYRDTDPQTVVTDTLLNDSPPAAVITPGVYETTLGQHVAGTLGRWRFDQEFAYMFGKRFERGVTPLASADLRSFLFSAQVHVRVAERLKPTLGAGFDFLSGDAVKGWTWPRSSPAPPASSIRMGALASRVRVACVPKPSCTCSRSTSPRVSSRTCRTTVSRRARSAPISAPRSMPPSRGSLPARRDSSSAVACLLQETRSRRREPGIRSTGPTHRGC